MLAVLKGHTKVVGILRDHGASFDIRNKDGWSVLMLAADFGDNSVIRELLIGRRLLHDSVIYLQVGMPQQDSQTTVRIQNHEATLLTTYLMELCCDMLGASAICHHVATRLFEVKKQMNIMTKIAQRGALKHLMEIQERMRIFLLKYSRKSTVIHLVSSEQIVETCRTIHCELDAFLSEHGLSSVTCIHCDWEKQFKEDVNTYKLDIDRSIRMDWNPIFEELRALETQQEVLALLLFECDTRKSKYTGKEIDLMHRVFRHVSSLSKLGIPSVPSWFVPPQDVDIDPAFASGSFGSVHRGRWNGADVVVKCAFVMDSQSRGMFMNEVEIWHKLQHPNVIQLYKACHVGNPFFVCEHAANGTLSDFLFRIKTPAKTWEKLLEAARGLRYLHEQHKVVHGDLKCNNILVRGTRSSGHGPAKLTDFGLSFKVVSHGHSDPIPEEVDAIQWKAPEVIAGKTRGSFASDVYSFGMCILEAVKEGLPWGNYPDVTVKRKLQLKHLPSRPDNVTRAQWEMISHMCAWEPSDRPAMKYVVDALEEYVRLHRKTAVA